MADETQEEQVQMWMGRILCADAYQKRCGNTGSENGESGRWDDNVRAMSGDFNSAEELGPEAIDVNMVRSTVKTILPPLTLTLPHVSVKPRRAKTKDGRDNIRAAEATEVEINYWMRELDVRKVVKKVTHEGEATNKGYVYVGYTKNKKELMVDGETVEYDPAVRAGQPFVQRHPAKDVLLPEGYDEFEDHPWVCLRWHKPVQEIRDRFNLPDLEPSEVFNEESRPQRQSVRSNALMENYLKTDDQSMVAIYDVWDKRTGKVYKLAEGHKQYIEEPKDWPWKSEGFPVEAYSPEYVPDEYYASPPLSFVLPQNKELNAARTALRKKMNRTKSIGLVDPAIDDEVIEKYKAADDGVLLKAGTDSSERPVKDLISWDTGIPFDTTSLAYDAAIKSDILIGSGISLEQRGSGDPNIDSATASQNVERNAQTRNSDRGDQVRSLYLGIARKLLMILREFPNEERTRSIVGMDGAIVRDMTFTLEELHGEFEFDMDFSAVLSDNPATRATNAALNYKLLRGDPLVNHEELILDLLRTQNKVSPQRYLLFLRSPDEEIQLMMQQIPVEAHDRDDHQSHMQAHEQQAQQLEQALAQQPDDPKMQSAMILLVAHVNDHAKKFQRIQQGNPQQSQPTDENSTRADIAQNRGVETDAELAGNPLGGGTGIG